jgi:hypothetical protein
VSGEGKQAEAARAAGIQRAHRAVKKHPGVRPIAGPGAFDRDRNSKPPAHLSKRPRINHPGFLVKIGRKKLASFIGQKRVNSEGLFAGHVVANGIIGQRQKRARLAANLFALFRCCGMDCSPVHDASW